MNVSLTPKLEEIVRQKVASGLYNNASEVVREAIRLLDARDRDVDRLRAAIAAGDESMRHGNVFTWTDTSMQDIIAEADEERRLGIVADADVRP